MLHTPATFAPLIRPQDHGEALTFVFHHGELLLRNTSLSLPAPAAVAGLAHVMDTALAALLVGVVLAAVGGSIAFIGIGRLKRTSLKPQQTIETLEEDKEWLKQLT